MNIVVTGATGFLGRRLVRRLVAEGLRVRCAVRPTSDVAALRNFVGDEHWPAVDLVRVHLADRDECRRLVEDADLVYHLAAALRGSPAVLFAGTVVTTRRLIEATAACDAVRRFVLVSSLAVYGAGTLPKGALLDEQCPVDPEPYRRDPYTYSKVVQEELAWEAYHRSQLPLVVVRPGVIYGDERGCLSSRVGLPFGRWLLQMGGRQRLPYTYVENCA
ncbi:MAG TPA: NAD(P)-dependent oxidoreductase, partial [Planctomycetaceae bacterium]|nr:NAD(P)-dependent oxidoreductase [Planctomycetaceae bacterium]